MSSNGRLYVADQTAGEIVIFAAGANGNAAPVATIAGSSTGLAGPCPLAFDSKGRLLVADQYSGLLVFAKGASGNASPVAKITTLVRPSGVAADAQDNIWAADFSGQSLDEFASDANGNAAPLHKIAGTKTHLNGPWYLSIH